MAETKVLAPSQVEEEHQAEAHAPYLKVWLALLIFTLIEYFYAAACKELFIILLTGLLFWAAIKAGLVGWYFMHLKFEGKWVYILIVPAFVLAAILVLALAPDVSMKPTDEETTGVEQSYRLAPSVSSGQTVLSYQGGRSVFLTDRVPTRQL
jgi:cytochrome c oxidase subunit 4